MTAEKKDNIVKQHQDIYGRAVLLAKDDNGYWVEHHKSGNSEADAEPDDRDFFSDYMTKEAAEKLFEERVNDGSYL